ncbi:T-cell surface glycoprotein CD3 gamma chain [Pitangus sulphuratus]|nr:T-cell surface glycoprotein CD3 gamma chain [Pitangus sulphuratus]
MWRGRALGVWAVLASLAVPSWGNQEPKIIVKETSGKVFLQCTTQGEVTWWKDGNEVGNENQLELSAVYDDPRGLYTCKVGETTEGTLQVHYRMCQNCIEVDAATVSGIVIADVIATMLLAVAVYCVTSHDRGHMSRASDRQNLIANDQLYQPLGEREDEQYSQLAPTRARK